MKYIYEMFMEQVEKNGERIAVYAADRTLTFRQLSLSASRIANALIRRGTVPGDRILVMMPRDSRFIITLFGIIKAGAGYVPADPEYPQDRVEYVRDNCSAKLVISDADIAGAVRYETLFDEGDEAEPEVTGRSPDHISYMIYTSGTTGTPKGVLLTQQGISNYLSKAPGNQYVNAIGEKYSVVMSATTVAFDVFEHELLVTLLHGASLVFTDEESSKNPYLMAKLIEEKSVDVFVATPSRVIQYLKIPAFSSAVGKLKAMWIAGEAFPMSLLRELRKVTKADLYNGYGPSEITIASHEKLLEDEITVGKPKPGYFDMVCNESGQPVPDGEHGELYIGGPGVSPGYWKLDELNQKKFLTIDGIRYYKSGDTAFRDENGEIHIIGRIDNQVKLNGLRIELGEIESLMQQFSGIRQAVVRVKQVRGADHLAAYYVADRDIDIEELKIFLGRKLVHYMIPDYFVRMDSFPVTANGKVDSRALAEIVPESLQTVEPESEMEKALWDLCVKEIGSREFGVTDPLRMIGFTSLSLLSIASFVLETWNTELKLTDLMQPDCTIRTVCRLTEESKGNSSENENRKLESYPVLPNQFPLLYKAERHQVIRKVIFGEGTDAVRLQKAVLKAVSSTPYFQVTFSIENGKTVQKRNSRDFSEAEIPIVSGEANDELCSDFCRYTDIFADRLCAFEIVSGASETVLLLRMHHILIDHGGMKLFCDRIVKAYDDPEADIRESYTYFDYAADVRADEAASAAEKAQIPAALPEKTETVIHSVTLPDGTPSPGNAMLAAIGRAVGEMLGFERFTIYHTFGGRKNARTFNTIGFFPYAIPMELELAHCDPAEIDAAVLASIDGSTPYDDGQYRRMTGDCSSLFVLYNYMDSFSGKQENRYQIKELHLPDFSFDPELKKAVPHLEFNTFSKGTRGMIMLVYDDELFSKEQIESMLKRISELVS